MYFTRNNLKNKVQKADKDRVTRLKVYSARKGPFDWENIVELPFNADEYSCAHPSIASDGRLYFASNMPGGEGGMDIYYVEPEGDGWSEPQNMGPQINTPENEVFPFIHNSGMLFFASNGHAGEGGLDIFATHVNENSTPVHLGAPFNSTADDLGLILNATATRGFFASARNGGNGKDDIYFFEIQDGDFESTTTTSFAVRMQVIDNVSRAPVPNAAIHVLEKTEGGFISGDNNLYKAVLMPSKEKSGELVFRLVKQDALALGEPATVTDQDGWTEYPLHVGKQYLLLASAEEYVNGEFLYSVAHVPDDPQLVIALDKSDCVQFTGTVKDRTTNGLLPDVRVQINSTCEDDNPILITDANGQFVHCLPRDCNHYAVSVFTENYQRETISISRDKLAQEETIEHLFTLTPEQEMTTTPPAPVIRQGAVIVLENIYYDFNKSSIRTGAAHELDQLATFMRTYSSMEIELISHTDSRGNKKYNRELSERRSESARQYLIDRGIQGYRIKAYGKGESEVRNRCVDGVSCSEEEHQYNRRTEVKVVRLEEGVEVKYD